MSRLTISLPNNLYNRIASLAIKNEASMSNLINQLIQVGLTHWFENKEKFEAYSAVDQHCQELIIQMNVLIKNIAVELLKLTQDDFDKLYLAAVNKLQELQGTPSVDSGI